VRSRGPCLGRGAGAGCRTPASPERPAGTLTTFLSPGGPLRGESCVPLQRAAQRSRPTLTASRDWAAERLTRAGVLGWTHAKSVPRWPHRPRSRGAAMPLRGPVPCVHRALASLRGAPLILIEFSRHNIALLSAPLTIPLGCCPIKRAPPCSPRLRQGGESSVRVEGAVPQETWSFLALGVSAGRAMLLRELPREGTVSSLLRACSCCRVMEHFLR